MRLLRQLLLCTSIAVVCQMMLAGVALAQAGCRGCSFDGRYCLLGCPVNDPGACGTTCSAGNEPTAGDFATCYTEYG